MLVNSVGTSWENSNNLLNKYGGELIKELSDILPETIKSLENKRQHKNIDILVIINETKAILIEDKVNTKDGKSINKVC